MKYKRPTKAVIAAAGFGTRFLPQTKAMPKEMMPLVDKPLIQYAVEELVAAGIKDIVIVTGYNKRSIEDHFDTPNAELAGVLESSGKQDSLADLRDISNLANFVYVRQKDLPGSNAAPLFYASHLIKTEPFVYCWADEIVVAPKGRVAQAIEVYERTGASVLPCIRLEHDEEYGRFGIAGGERVEDLIEVSSIQEKPGKAKALSDLGSIGGYILTPDVLSYIERMAPAALANGGDLSLQAAIQAMIDDGHPYVAFEIEGAYYDAGDKLEYVKTVVDFALNREDIGQDFRKYLLGRLDRN